MTDKDLTTGGFYATLPRGETFKFIDTGDGLIQGVILIDSTGTPLVTLLISGTVTANLSVRIMPFWTPSR